MAYNNKIIIENKQISSCDPTYFIADIAANHDGDLQRAIDLIYLAKESGADAAKFQHFSARSIVSDFGFVNLGRPMGHQSKWSKSVFDVYNEASIDLGWTALLKDTCIKAGITFLTSPYSLDLVDHVDPFIAAYKIGSGDVTWVELIEHVASKGKPIILASGAATLEDVQRAVTAATALNPMFVLMQCNTNYTGSSENFKFIQLNVLHTYEAIYPGMVLGLSDHTPGYTTVLGAVAIGARVIEKHFTDDTSRKGPDHLFSMNPNTWKEMVTRTRELEDALGNGTKKIEDNEKETAILQRRCIRLKRDVVCGERLVKEDLEVLRPCPSDGLPPYKLAECLGRATRRNMLQGQHLRFEDIE